MESEHNDKFRQVMVIVSILVTIIVNTLANALPLNGVNTGEISDRFEVYFTPAGYVFSIWGLIYIGLIAFAIYQALPAQAANPRLRRIGWWVVLGGVANSAWIFLWHYQQFVSTIFAMLLLLVSLVVVYLNLGTGRSKASPGETWAVRVPFSIYLGWITVATVANLTALLDYLGWDGFGIPPETWMWIVLGAVLLISLLVILTRRDVAYTLVILWAVAGIAIKHAAVAPVATAARVTFALVLIGLFVSLLIKRPRKTPA